MESVTEKHNTQGMFMNLRRNQKNEEKREEEWFTWKEPVVLWGERNADLQFLSSPFSLL